MNKVKTREWMNYDLSMRFFFNDLIVNNLFSVSTVNKSTFTHELVDSQSWNSTEN